MRIPALATLSVIALALCGCSTPTSTPAAPSTDDGGTTVRSAGLSLITEPGPGDRPFIALIDSARHSIEMTMYELTDQRVEQALAAAASRGVQVAVLLDHGQYGDGRPLNDAAYRYLATHNVTVAWAPTDFALTHQKSIVIDRRVAAIMTLNLTPAYYSSSRDFAVLDYRPADVARVAQTFDADLHHRRLTPSTGTGELVWSPGAQAPIAALIAHAQRSLQVESEELDDPTITRQLCQAAERGVRVQVLMTYQPTSRAALTYLAGCRAQVRTYPENAALYIHAKLIRADGNTVFIGSQNLSRQSLTYNRELGIITHNPQIAAGTGRTFTSDFAAAQPYQQGPPAPAAPPARVRGTAVKM
jgi:phosphatidylserine/phosphatidylglycerophosphate/cardiolipin synthase-like enzyme